MIRKKLPSEINQGYQVNAVWGTTYVQSDISPIGITFSRKRSPVWGYLFYSAIYMSACVALWFVV